MKNSLPLHVAATTRGVCLGVALFLTALISAPLQADSQVLVANQDTFIRGGTANENTNFDTTVNLQLAGRGVDNARKIYLGFDLSAVNAGSGFEATSSLSLSLGSTSLIGGAAGPVTFNVYGITDNTPQFDETLITWDNAPKNNKSSSSAFHVTNVALLGSFTIDSNSVSLGQSISLSGLGLANYLNWAIGNSGDFYNTGRTQANGKKITLMIATDSAYTGISYPGFYIYSSEAAVSDALKPHLVLNTGSAIPEPSSAAALLGLCGLSAAVLRRKGRG